MGYNVVDNLGLTVDFNTQTGVRNYVYAVGRSAPALHAVSPTFGNTCAGSRTLTAATVVASAGTESAWVAAHPTTVQGYLNGLSSAHRASLYVSARELRALCLEVADQEGWTP